ncbi:GMC oxidoreductase, partial [Glycomyces tenuis]|uniref:GMC oxidoreductase n=1 Tax=Glycomyces tenuis TaxID=58116 RepID=UPI00068D8B90
MTERMDADVIVIGSGFGGAVAAARLAQAGHAVLVLERGGRWRPGDFPRDPDLRKGWLWQAGGGLYDIRWLDRMASVQAAGWGGGSLVYANVFARPADGALDPRWPAHLRREALDPYYDLAAHMLEVAPTGPDPRTGRVPERTALVEDLAARSDIVEATMRPNLAVTFGDPEQWRPNRHGVPRRGCAFVGECVLGCNHGAKNTLDHNYLAVAEAAGARAVTDAQAERIEPCDGGYDVHASTPSDPEAPERRWRAGKVVLAAGAIATTELLLRARDVHRTLPGLSRRLGHGFSGNGDFLTMAELRRRTGDAADTGDMTTGPTITTTTVLDVPEGRESVWYQVQDGAVPMPLRELIDSVIPGRRLRARWRRIRGTDRRRGFAVLAMGRDSSDGVLRLGDDGNAVLSWRTRWQAKLHRSQSRVGPLLARQFGARMSNPPTWSLLRRTVTVHALGGVPEGEGPETGVVDEYGEVHGHPGLFVMDGSRLPAATGVNPSASILAVAERSVEAMIRRSGRTGWRAPEWDDVAPAPVPEDAAFDFMAERRGGGG